MFQIRIYKYKGNQDFLEKHLGDYRGLSCQRKVGLSVKDQNMRLLCYLIAQLKIFSNYNIFWWWLWLIPGLPLPYTNMYDWVKKWAVIFTTYLNIITQASRWPTIKGHLTLSEKSINSERPRPIHFWPRLNLKSGTCAWRKKPPPGEEGLDHLVPGQVGEAQPIKGRRWRQGTAAASSWGWLVVFCIQAVPKKTFWIDQSPPPTPISLSMHGGRSSRGRRRDLVSSESHFFWNILYITFDWIEQNRYD